MRIFIVGKYKDVEQIEKDGVKEYFGDQYVIYFHAKYLSLRGHQVLVLSHSDKVKEYERFQNPYGVEVLRVNEKLLYTLPFRKAFKDSIEHIIRGSDIIHFQSSWKPFFYLLIPLIKKYNKPYVITPHGGYHPKFIRRNWVSFLKKKAFTPLEREFLRGSAFLHAFNSEDLKNIRNFCRENHRFLLLPNGVEIPSNEVYEEPVLDLPDNYFVYIGRLAYREKGLDLIFEALGKLKAEGKNPVLVIVGGNEKDVAQIKEKLNGTYDNVVFYGKAYGAKKREILKRAKFQILVSRSEGFPISVLEGMALGKPVLVSKETNMGGLVKKFNTGLVVNLDVDEIASAIWTLYSGSENKLREMGLNGYHLVKQYFTWPPIVEMLEKAYDAVLKGEWDEEEEWDYYKAYGLL